MAPATGRREPIAIPRASVIGGAVREAATGQPTSRRGQMARITAQHTLPQRPRAKTFVCAVKDVWARRIVGRAVGERTTSELADTALRTTIARRRPTGIVIVHSGRSSRFPSHRDQRTQRAHGFTVSMGRVAAAGARGNEISSRCSRRTSSHGEPPQKHHERHLAIAISIERGYHRRRRQGALDRHTPVELKAAVGFDALAISA